jgi:hypothetical protein
MGRLERSSTRLAALRGHLAPLSIPAAAPAAGSGSADDGLPAPAPAPGTSPSTSHLEALERVGWTVVDDFVGSQFLPELLAASRRVIAAANNTSFKSAGSCPTYVHRASSCRKESADRPQWSGKSHTFVEEEAWAIRGLIHPAWHEPIFAEFCASDEVLAFVRRWTGCEKEELTHGDPTLFCAPTEGDFSEGYHRDARWWGGADETQQDEQAQGGDSGGSGGPRADYSLEAQEQRWKELTATGAEGSSQRRKAEGRQDVGDELQIGGIAWMLALVEDTCHEIVPGSHVRFRTEFENSVLCAGARMKQGSGGGGYMQAAEGGPNSHSAIPSAEVVQLRPGQALVRNGLTIHRGCTRAGVERATLSLGWNKWDRAGSLTHLHAFLTYGTNQLHPG